ncbi:MAG: Hsp20/alpha crystallin family protein [Bacillota bacterium]|nr:Hsp20/alpha crystallin family protein [Bacillota bacterium]
MTLMRWDPWRELTSFREAINRLFDETLTRRFGWGEWKPSVDMVDRGTEFVVRADLPGYSPENVEITVQENAVLIHGKVKEERETKEENYQVRERSYGSFARSLPLPVPIIPEQARASFKNGVLEIILPKVEAPKGRTLQIETE